MSKTTAIKRPPLDDSNYAAWFWHRQSVADRIRALDNIEQDAEVAFAPFLNDKITNVGETLQ